MATIIYIEDYNLLNQYIKGDKNSGNILFSKIYPNVEKYVYKNVRQYVFITEEDKLDIIAEGMSRSVAKCCDYNGTVPFKNFVIGFCRNVILEYLRKGQKNSKIVSINQDESVDIEDLTRIGENPLSIVINKEKLEILSKAIENLSEEHRQVLQMRLINCVKVKQIALLTGETEAAIDSRFRRAIVALKRNFESLYF